MAGTKEIKRRIKSVKNTNKITKAMELVAASKMKRAVSATLASRLYAQYSSEILASIAETLKDSTNPFFNERSEGKTLVVLITSNRGLCGGYNSQVIKKAVLKLRDLSALGSQESLKHSPEEIDVVTVGKKGDAAMRRINQNITEVFTDLPDVDIHLADVRPLSKLIMDEYKINTYKKVYIIYTQFVSALLQRPTIKQVLPISKEEVAEALLWQGQSKASATKTDYLFEGNKDELIASFAEKITRMQIYQMILESNAGEQSSRMVAMKNASDASLEMIGDLTLAFNKARQANITREISEISAGMTSVS
jgi:F-type H+-transporting ATPase subunit gamma